MKLSDMKTSTPEQEMAVKNCILMVRCGSHLYGTSTPKSDDDFTGVFVPDKDYVLGKKYVTNTFGQSTGHRIQQVEFNTNPSDSGKPNQKGDFDCTLFALDKWTTMAAANNPNRLELFFVPENCVVHITPLGKKFLASYKNFVSLKSYGSFRGYSHEQMARLKLKSGNNTGRKELQEEFGYDVKLAHHNIRLYLECIQLLKEGKITFPLREARMLMEIKTGLWSKEDFFKKSEQLSALCETVYANSTLQPEPDMDAINKLQIEIYEEFWGNKYN